jgi:uncharacterized membrane protein YhfC
MVPVPVAVIGGVLGAVTLAAAVPAWRGSRPGTITVVASRVLSALLGVPAYFVGGTPAWAKIEVTVAIVLTVVATWLVLAARRDRALRGAPAR